MAKRKLTDQTIRSLVFRAVILNEQQRQLAHELAVSEGLVSSYANGRLRPDIYEEVVGAPPRPRSHHRDPSPVRQEANQ